MEQLQQQITEILSNPYISTGIAILLLTSEILAKIKKVKPNSLFEVLQLIYNTIIFKKK